MVIFQDRHKISAMYLWLPLYLNDHLGYPPLTAGLLSTSFDIGGVAGGPILGCLSDSRGTTLGWVLKASLCVCLSLAIITMFNPNNVLILGMFVSDCYSHVFIKDNLYFDLSVSVMLNEFLVNIKSPTPFKYCIFIHLA